MFQSITFAPHAEKRMRLRALSKADVEEALRLAQTTVPADEGRLRAIYSMPDGTARSVVYAVLGRGMSGLRIVVITVW